MPLTHFRRCDLPWVTALELLTQIGDETPECAENELCRLDISESKAVGLGVGLGRPFG